MIVRQEKKRPKFRISIIFTIILLSFAGCFLYYMKNSSPTALSEDDNSIEAAAYITSETNNEAPLKIENPIPENKPADSEYLNSCVFIGDSVISSLVQDGLIAESCFMRADKPSLSGINNAVTEIDGESISLSEALKKSSASSIYIALGTDDIADMTNKSMLDEYSTFLKTAASQNSGKTIYIILIPPVTAEKESDRAAPVLNTAIDSYNAGLLELANENNICCLDLNSSLKGSDGRLSPEFAEGDGFTLNESGRKKVIEYILTHTYQS